MKRILLVTFCFCAYSAVLCQSSVQFGTGTSVEIGAGADLCADQININGTYTGTGTLCDGPLPVTLSSFSYSVHENKVLLSWTAENESNNYGFEIEISDIKKNGGWKKIAFVPGRGTASEPKTYKYEDKNLLTGVYRYRLKQIDFNGNSEYFPLAPDVIIEAPVKYSMSQNYPNPFNASTIINYQLPRQAGSSTAGVIVKLALYDVTGKEVAVLVNEIKKAGYYEAEFDGSNLTSGVYFYQLSVNNKALATKRMVLIK